MITLNVCFFFLSSEQGETILKALGELSGKLSVRIAVNLPQATQPKEDLQLLTDSGKDAETFVYTVKKQETVEGYLFLCLLGFCSLFFLCVSGAEVRTVNMRKLTSGVLHTKFWVIDKKHVYIGSANMDWRSLTQVHTHTHQYTLLCFH